MTALASPPRGINLPRPHAFLPDWDRYVVTKVKHVRAVMLAGLECFRDETFSVPQATGFIELTGMRAGAYKTLLKIGFTDAQKTPSSSLPDPSFQVFDNEAVGTLVMSSHCFAPALQFANSAMAHFRIGGDGRKNALATDIALLNALV